GYGAVRFDHARQRPAAVPSRRPHAQLRRDLEELANPDVRQHRTRARARLSGRIHPDVGVLPLLLRGWLSRALHRRRADAADQARLPTRPDSSNYPPAVTERPLNVRERRVLSRLTTAITR